MIKVLFVTYDFPYPLNSGGKNRAFHLIKYAVGNEARIDLLSFTRKGFNSKNTEKLKEIGVGNITTYERKSLRSFSTLAGGIISKGSVFKSLYYDKNFLSLLEKEISEKKYDIVHFESSYTGFYISERLREFGVKQVLGTENIEFLLYEDLSKKEKNPIKKKIIEAQARRLKSEEEKMMNLADLCIAVTKEEADIIKKISGKNVKVVENAVDKGKLKFAPRTEINNNILFVGNFLYAPNIDAVNFLVKQVLPLIDKKTTLTIIGKEISKIGISDKRVILKEFVDDIVREYNMADALVSPVKVGGGTNFKVLEAMALGTVVIAFPERLSALGAKNGVHFIEADSANSFAENIRKVTDDKSVGTEIIKNARELVEKNYSWEKVGEKLSKAWKEML